MMKFKSLVLAALIFLFAVPVFLNPALARHGTAGDPTQKIITFDLFWPIAPGKVMGDGLYTLKSLKEKVREMFIFSSYQKADYNIVLVEKRFAEAEKLLVDNKDFNNFGKTLEAANSKRARVLDLLHDLESDGIDTANLKERFEGSLEDQRALLMYWQTLGNEGAKSAIDKDSEAIASALSNLQ